MHSDVYRIISALRVATVSNLKTDAGQALWERVKEHVERTKPDGLAILDYFVEAPVAMREAMWRLLNDTRADENQEIVRLGAQIAAQQRTLDTIAGEPGHDSMNVIPMGLPHQGTAMRASHRRPVDLSTFEASTQGRFPQDDWELEIVPEDRVGERQSDGWVELTMGSTEGPPASLLIVSGSHVLGVPLVRPRVG